MNGFNLSDWALERRSLLWYFMIVFLIAGAVRLSAASGARKTPNFTIKTMVVQAHWPGATAEEVTRQVTERIEKKLEELEVARLHPLDHHRRQDHRLRQSAADHQGAGRRSDLDARAQHDRRHQGPVPQRRAGAFLQRPLRRRLWQHLRLHQRRPDVAPIARPRRGRPLEGPDRAQCRPASISSARRTRRSISNSPPGRSRRSASTISRSCSTLAAQNAVTPSGFVAGRAGTDRHSRRGQFTSEDSLRSINLRVNDRISR